MSDKLVNTARCRVGSVAQPLKGLAAVLRTPADSAAVMARLVVGGVMLPHAAQHSTGWFGGPGYTGTMAYFASIGIPAVVGFLTILIEVAGSVMLILGLASRPAAVGIGGVMIGAMLTVHLPNGSFMDWFGQLSGEGFEFHILMLGLVVVIALKGGGALSVDRYLADRLEPAALASAHPTETFPGGLR